MNKFFVFILLLSSYSACFSMGNPKWQYMQQHADGGHIVAGCYCSSCKTDRQIVFEAQQKLALKQTTLTEAITQKTSFIEAKANSQSN